MLKHFVAVCAALMAGGAIMTSATEAQAGYCGGCAPVRPVYTYSTVRKVTTKVQYRDVSRVRYVKRIKRIYHVKRIQPIVRLHVVTRVHYRTVAVVQPVHVYAVRQLPPRVIKTYSTVRINHCGCR